MSATFQGNQILGLQRQTGDAVTQLEDGTWEGEVIYICRWALLMTLAPQRNIASHPDFPNLKCRRVQVTRLKPGVLCELRVGYRGFFGNEDDPPSLPDSTEEVVTSMSDAPIETHPNFTSTIGGTQATPLNGAVFNDDKTFKGWEADSPYAGIESYLVPSTIYRKTTPSRVRPSSVGDVGSISSPGIGGPGDSNWLYTGRTWRRDGGVYEVSEEWMLSGPGGWDPTIY